MQEKSCILYELSHFCRMTPSQLKMWRAKKGLSQADAAAELQQSIHTIRSWEQGKNPIPAWVERQTTMESDMRIPLDLVTSINRVASEGHMTFDEAFQIVLKAGVRALDTDQPSK